MSPALAGGSSLLAPLGKPFLPYLLHLSVFFSLWDYFNEILVEDHYNTSYFTLHFMTGGSKAAPGSSPISLPSPRCLEFGEKTSVYSRVVLADYKEELCGQTGPEKSLVGTFWKPLHFQ